ncbi:MAG: radical SAM protein [Deltaproteobacteria bacterium]|nr:radical SAM protein [Deltaproteobacteria bacterium]
MNSSDTINIHAVIPSSRVNGPGRRMVVFFQGCGRNCPGCFNPETHSDAGGLIKTPQQVFDESLTKGIEGLTVSGGEPFEQPDGLTALVRLARTRYGLTTVVYTGFTIEELQKDPQRGSALQYIDVLIDGPYKEGMKETTLLARGSTNQRLIFLSNRYQLADFYMPGKAELTISSEGVVTGTGFGRCVGPPRASF